MEIFLRGKYSIYEYVKIKKNLVKSVKNPSLISITSYTQFNAIFLKIKKKQMKSSMIFIIVKNATHAW